MATNYRAYQLQNLPTWLRDPAGVDGYHQALGDGKDAQVERLKLSVVARMPLRAPTDALELLGDERGIPRGQGEADPAYSLRLWGAWNTWPYAGTALGVLNTLRYAGLTAALVQQNRYGFALDAGGALVVSALSGGTWTTDAQAAWWNRFSVILLAPLPAAWIAGSAITFAATGAGASSAYLTVTGTPAADVRLVAVVTTAGTWSAGTARFALSSDGGATFPLTAQTPAQVAAVALTYGITIANTATVQALNVADRLFVQPAFNVPADGSAYSAYVKRLVADWKSAHAIVARYIIPTAGRILGWPVRQLGVVDGSGQVPRLGGSTVTYWSP
jgi:hypothetical protein